MTKFMRAILVSAYSALIFQFLNNIFSSRYEEIIVLDYRLKSPGSLKKLNRLQKKFGYNVTIIDLSFKPPERLPTDLKYILVHTEAFSRYSSSIYKNGQEAFIESNCSYYNCYFSHDKHLLVDPRNYDAVLLAVENRWDDHPLMRSLHQKYIFTASESADHYPMCDPRYDTQYNWTWSYKLDSDIPWTYISVLDKNGIVVGPNINMSWVYPMKPISDEVKMRISKKNRTAAWFASSCRSKNNRENVTAHLQMALGKYGLGIDVYGRCGNFTCPKDRLDECLEILERDYYFYLSFENSMAEDYVTEKILYPTKHYTVPIVFGGADYSRFLPPNSYINAADQDPEAVASLMIETMFNKELYQKYFEWYNHYNYTASPEVANVCKLCQMLNEQKDRTVVKDFRRWWNPNFEKECKTKDLNYLQNFRQDDD